MTGSGGCNEPSVQGTPSNEQSLCLEADGAMNGNTEDPQYLGWRLGQNLRPDVRIRPNTWTLVKLHIKTTNGAGAYEAWIKERGGSFIKVTQWIHGQNNFTWPINNNSGQSMVRMPTVMNSPVGASPPMYSWQYMDDFVIATSEADLPVYGSTTDKYPIYPPIQGISPTN